MNRKEKEKILDALLSRGIIEEILPSIEEFKTRILSEKPMHIYLGIDPTSNKIHLGTVQQLLLLEEFHKIGAKITILLGETTARIGDPTDHNKERPMISSTDISKNISSLKKQIKSVIKVNFFDRNIKIITNNWYKNINVVEFLSISSKTTVQHLLQRDMFEKRMESGNPVHIHEFLYPVLQGYDSVKLDVDAELCGTDQTFNALMGRTFQKKYNDKEKFIITSKLIEDEKSGIKMSKSTGTGIFIDLSKRGANNMFGAVMSLPDTMIFPVFLGATRVYKNQIDKYRKEIDSGVNPRDIKIKLAEAVVGLFYNSTSVEKAKQAFISQFQKREIDESTPEINLTQKTEIIDFLVDNNICSSRGEAKNKIKEGALSVNKEKITSIDYVLEPTKTKSIRLGRQQYKISSL